MEWIAFTLFAALMQSVRTAGQKQMTQTLTAVVATWARYGFGLPVAAIYLAVVLWQAKCSLPALSVRFVLYVSIAAIAQLGATLLLVKLLSFRSFAVGTTYAKTEGLLAGVIAAVIFHRALEFIAWLAVIIGLVGIVFVSLKKSTVAAKKQLTGYPVLLG